MKHKPKYDRFVINRPVCGGKNRYPTKSQAEAVKLEQEIIDAELNLRVYRCVSCGDWHLTRVASSNF
ncbi:MAG TPA: hypothetical protein VFK03_02045 [Candidatus Saccharimonadales bacterium]|nr:hypothetical protein [Candidatus Saccharimonadales bacterium]